MLAFGSRRRKSTRDGGGDDADDDAIGLRVMLKEPLPSYHGIFPHPQDLKSARVFSLHFSVKLSHYFLSFYFLVITFVFVVVGRIQPYKRFFGLRREVLHKP